MSIEAEKQKSSEWTFKTQFSYLEIYQEKVNIQNLIFPNALSALSMYVSHWCMLLAMKNGASVATVVRISMASIKKDVATRMLSPIFTGYLWCCVPQESQRRLNSSLNK
jgi:hypothetical protein